MKSKTEQEEHNKQTDHAMLQILVAIHTKDDALLQGAKERMLQLGHFRVGNMPSESLTTQSDDAQRGSEVGATSA